MPKPEAGESQQDYMKRCVPMVKDEGASQEQAVGKCLGMYRHYTGSESILEKINNKLSEATVVGEVGKRIATETQCPKGKVWCSKCHACVDIRSKPGMGVPAHCPHMGRKGMFTWEGSLIDESVQPADVNLSNVKIHFLEAEPKAKWKTFKVKNLRELLKKTKAKIQHSRLVGTLKMQIDKMNIKELWFYIDPYDDYIYNKRKIYWAWSKKEAEEEITANYDAIAEREPWNEKSFGRIKTI